VGTEIKPGQVSIFIGGNKLKNARGVEQQRHGAIVDQLYPHVRSKAARRHPRSLRAQRLDQSIELLARDLGLGGLMVAGSPAFAAVAQQRELRHDRELALDLEHGSIHLAVGVGEHAKV